MSRDGPDSATEQHCIVEEGDIIVAASDGLFDNLHDCQIVDLVAPRARGEDEQEQGEDKEEERVYRRSRTIDKNAAKRLGNHAFSVARSCTANSPFAESM